MKKRRVATEKLNARLGERSPEMTLKFGLSTESSLESSASAPQKTRRKSSQL